MFIAVASSVFFPQLVSCEERLGLVEKSLSSTQDQLSARVSEVKEALIDSLKKCSC